MRAGDGAFLTSNTLFVIADAFYPAELPPESQTNTLLATSLGRRGWNVVVWAGRGARRPDGAGKVDVRSVRRGWGKREVARIALWLMAHRPRRIILMYHKLLYSGDAAITLVPAIARLLGLDCQTYFTFDGDPGRLPAVDRVLRRLGFRDEMSSAMGPLAISPRITFLSDAARRRALSGVPVLASRCSVVSPPSVFEPPAATDRDQVRRTLGLGTDSFAVVYFGLIYAGKGIEWLLEAVARVADRVPVTLVLVGPDGAITRDKVFNKGTLSYSAGLREQAKRLGIAERILWLGEVERDQVAHVLSACDVACLPFDDGLTNLRSSFIACAKLGLPTVTTRTEETDAFLLEPESGISYVDPRDAGQIAERIEDFYRRPEQRASAGAGLKRFAARHFDNERFVDAFDPRVG